MQENFETRSEKPGRNISTFFIKNYNLLLTKCNKECQESLNYKKNY
jgi:hypothetical protein